MSGREAVLPDSFSPDGGSTPGPGVLEEFAQACRGDLTRVRISGGVREFDCTAELIVTHSHLSQRGRSAARGDEVENAGGGVGYTQGSRYSRHDFRDARRVERHCLGKDNGVGGSMRQTEAATEGVAQLVMKPHTDRAQAGSGQPGCLQ